MNRKKIILLLSLSLVIAGCQKTTKEINAETKLETILESVSDVSDSDKNDSSSIQNYREIKSPLFKVNGQEVSFEKYYKYFDLYSSLMAMNNNLTSDLTNLMIRDKIINEELKSAGINIADEEINNEINEYKKNLGGDEEFNKYISTLGVDIDLFKENIRNSLANQKHSQYYKEKNSNTDEEITNYYNQNKDSIDYVEAKHILVEDEQTANEIYDRLVKGEDFATLSNEFSIDTAAKANGGQLGRISRTGFDAAFVEAAFKLTDNELSKPVKTSFGYHIIFVTKNNIGIEKNKENINLALLEKKYTEYINKKLQEVNLEFFDVKGNKLEKKN